MTPTPRKSSAKPQSSLFASQNEQDTRHKSESSHWITAYTDGGSRGNPGPAGYGVVLQTSDGATVAELSEFLGIQTNNVAEYSALLGALDYALAHDHNHLRVVSDSELMVKQIRGQYSVKSPDLRPLYEEAKRRIARLDGFEIQHVLRGKNRHADQLANDAMDRGMNRGMNRGMSLGMKGDTRGNSSGTQAAAVQAPAVQGEKRSPIRGIVRHGAVQLPENALPEGTVVIVMPEDVLRGRG
ncbi:MAG TPA: ribonuclease HI family protein [Acidobacteriaceae bacterium]|jgi:probable phosphoglycerate mutase|nr:ribonuclease HI family protein [Acidobacteriaceae bacterium]